MPERQCVKCTKQAEWGCEAFKYRSDENDRRAIPDDNGGWWAWFKPSHLPMTVDGEESYACPRQDLKQRAQAWNRMLLYYGMYKQGFLPQAGAIMDQSNKAMELFRIFDQVNGECDEAQAERTRAGQARDEQTGGKGLRR
jgi:hypothetical protein